MFGGLIIWWNIISMQNKNAWALDFGLGIYLFLVELGKEIMDISSLEAAYIYVLKIEHNFQQKNKWQFGPVNPMQKQGNGNHGFQNKGQGKENQFQPQEKEGNGNT